MRWQGRRGSRNIEDRRGRSGRGVVGGGGLGIVAIALLVWALGGDPIAVLQDAGTVQTGQSEVTEEDEQAADFVSVVLADTEEIWADVFQEQVGQDYVPTTLVLFKTSTTSACGGASALTGPFYCPVDKRIYLDTAFSPQCRANLAQPEILQQPMWLRMRLATTCKTCWVYWIKRLRSGSA